MTIDKDDQHTDDRDVTDLLVQWRQGDKAALDTLIPLVYRELRGVDTPEGKRPYVEQMPYWISTATLAGLPATVAPVGRTDAGVPVGLQIIAPMWEDGTAIEFAALLSDVVGGFTAPSGFQE